MRIFSVLLLSLPLLIATDCNEETEKELEKEREEDARFHGCRSCRKEPEISLNACPDVGYDCSKEWTLTANVLSPTDRCRCLAVRCSESAMMAFNKHIFGKVRCNNSIWMAGDAKADAVVCAKSCNTGVCKASNPRASPDFKPLKVKAADGNNRCATGTCEPDYGMAAINDDGSLDTALEGVSEVSCTSEGAWVAGSRHNYVMCNASPCGPTRCPAYIDGPAMDSGVVIPLTVAGNGEQCATATCANGFVLMKTDGTTNGILDDTNITCQEDGTWIDNSKVSHAYVMCAPPPCKNTCDPTLFPSVHDPSLLIVPNRKDCTFSCPANMGLYHVDATRSDPISTEKATCESNGKYRVNSTLLVDKIGCYPCDFPDGILTDHLGDGKVKVQNCVLLCPDDFIVSYYTTTTTPDASKLVDRVYVIMTSTEDNWYDPVIGEAFKVKRFECKPL